MKAITLHQPWASFKAIGIKRNETRSWKTSHRGDLVICSAKKFYHYTPMKAGVSILLWKYRVQLIGEEAASQCKDFEDVFRRLPLGKALCVVWVDRCLPTEHFANDGHPRSNIEGEEFMLGDYSPNRFAWETTNCRRLTPPIQVKGAQGLWPVPPSIVERIKSQVKIF